LHCTHSSGVCATRHLVNAGYLRPDVDATYAQTSRRYSRPDVEATMRFSDGVLDVVTIFLTKALRFSCTGT